MVGCKYSFKLSYFKSPMYCISAKIYEDVNILEKQKTEK